MSSETLPRTGAAPAAPEAVAPGGVPSVVARHLTKRYELGELASLSRTLRDLRHALRGRRRRPEYFEALSDVSFEVGPGEAFTVLGTNGSGKTTLLSILTGLLVPEEGEALIRGRVTPLLSVGSAFHPDLTGRENAVLFGTILGLSRREIGEAMPAVREFSGLTDQHLATPIKRYSEGMKARLAFATAMRFPADLLVLDEVLVVADDAFKEQCVGEIKALVGQGKSVIFVSHELPLVRAICDRGVWLERGRVQALGAVDEVVDAYEPFRHRVERAEA